VQAADEPAQLGDGVLGLLVGVVEQLADGRRVLLVARLGAAERHPQRDEALLGAVVQVALELAPFRLPCVDDAGAAALQLVHSAGEHLGHRAEQRAGEGDVRGGERAQHGGCGEQQHEAEPGEQGAPAPGVDEGDPVRGGAVRRDRQAEQRHRQQRERTGQQPERDPGGEHPGRCGEQLVHGPAAHARVAPQDAAVAQGVGLERRQRLRVDLDAEQEPVAHAFDACQYGAHPHGDDPHRHPEERERQQHDTEEQARAQHERGRHARRGIEQQVGGREPGGRRHQRPQRIAVRDDMSGRRDGHASRLRSRSGRAPSCSSPVLGGASPMPVSGTHGSRCCPASGLPSPGRAGCGSACDLRRYR
jgi:hypothetical protein